VVGNGVGCKVVHMVGGGVGDLLVHTIVVLVVTSCTGTSIGEDVGEYVVVGKGVGEEVVVGE